MKSQTVSLKSLFSKKTKANVHSPFQIILRKEIADHIRSWRFLVLLSLIALTFVGSMYVSLSNLKQVIANIDDPDRNFIYLKLLTTTDNSIPPFHIFLSFLAPLLGISLGFDTINTEQNNGTLTRMMAQPIYRDNLVLAKFTSAFLLVSTLFIVITLLMIGSGLLLTGVRIEPSEILRILGFTVVSIVYVAFWLSIATLASIKFKQAATASLAAIGLWLFFTIFYQIIVNVLIRSILPDPSFLTQHEISYYNEVILNILRLSPNQLYTDATTTLLMPSVRSLGPLTVEQMAGAIPSPLPVIQSILIVWPQLSGLIAGTITCFALSYYLFMRREIRS